MTGPKTGGRSVRIVRSCMVGHSGACELEIRLYLLTPSSLRRTVVGAGRKRVRQPMLPAQFPLLCCHRYLSPEPCTT
jgi:hypothetical protein